MKDAYLKIVEEYVNTDTDYSKILMQTKYDGDYYISLIRSLDSIHTIIDEDKINKIFFMAEEFEKTNFHPLGKMFFYLFWCQASLVRGLTQQCDLILQKAKRLKLSDAPPILLSTIKNITAHALGSKLNYVDSLLSEYKDLGKTSPRFKNRLRLFYEITCTSGMGVSKAENLIDKYRDEAFPIKNDLYYFCIFSNDLARCDLNSIAPYFQIINKNLAQNSTDIEIPLAIYELQLNRSLSDTAKFIKRPFFKEITLANSFLLNHKPDLALAELQKLENINWDLININFLRYTHIRVELCNKNIEAAYQLIKAKIKNSGGHFMDDFFLARLELLRGNREKAFQYFSKAYQQCDFYFSINRLYFELDMALEMKTSDIFFLTKNLFQTPIKVNNKVNYDEILTSKELTGVARLIGKSEAIAQIKKDIITFSVTNLPLLIMGETGVGKDIVARALHEESPRKKEPFLAINCAAIADSLLQSELFGHLAGSYTGAISEHKGVFLDAGKGTVFLDEIGEISPAIQVALLRVLENNEIKPVGGSHQVLVQCRIIAATNANLEQLVAKKLFREDLFYRLKRLEIYLPPLRERKDDILPLTNYFLKVFRHSFEAPQLSVDFQNGLLEFNWPGNIRQLKNEIEKMDLLKSRKAKYELSDFDFLAMKNKTTKLITKIENIQSTPNDVKDEALTAWRRLEKIKNLFDLHKDLTRKEIARNMKISLATATTDLQKLIAEKYIVKIEPSSSTRSHYFILNSKN